jgi:3D (Asp-Asp-Asp) domain-containing protein
MKPYLTFIAIVTALSLYVESAKDPPRIMTVIRHLPQQIFRVTGTYYNPVEGQCDDRPEETADGSRVRRGVRWIAMSRDLLRRWGGEFDYGDTVYVESPEEMLDGQWVVHDCMNARFTRRIDFLSFGSELPGRTEGILISKTKIVEK